ncbi:MAG: MlaE family lipid ABC transporter permease subunit [Phycisphaerae bacterium]|nr:MlaE family lipid ABC transporter permease subunit [Phycisphaerae bacterium]
MLSSPMEIEQDKEGILRLTFSGRLDVDRTSDLWRKAEQILQRSKPQSLFIDAHEVSYCDGAGVSLLLNLAHYQKNAEADFEIQGLQGKFRKLMDLFDPGQQIPPPPKASAFRRVPEDAGRAVVAVMSDIKMLVAFVGELTVTLLGVLIHPRRLRWKDAFLVAENAGANAFGIIALMSLLFGLILAFQSAIPMQRFGAQIFVIDLISISVVRELGPLITAIILAGRTGSAFAAELGTMKVNEELNALETMGLDPVRFLVAPRVLAAVFVTPLLVIFSNLFAIIGGCLVMNSLGFTLATSIDRIHSAVGLSDILGGLFKSVIFGLLVAAIGCLRGLQTATGAQAVGISATRAVVSGIFLILLSDGVFAVLFYYLGI